ncbi:hypothetical protein NIASO_05230 [Niabella soli DSM 19437]|uniref:Uncharacterized protein n=2 Tax=Niabella TaxID=379899 RepID=W0F2P3_9BACT|nr:hypothetical protein NIASO_05230 [Niabella soli DSM 19437]
MNISIPVPCHEDWNQMKPEDRGRFCGICAKTVTDFAGMTAQEISDFLIRNQSEKICGRFTDRQLAMEYDENIQTIAIRIAQTGWPLVKKMAAIFLFLFLLSHPGQAQSVNKKPPGFASTINAITIPKRDSLVTTDSTVTSVDPSQCIEGKLGRVIMTSEKKKNEKQKRSGKYKTTLPY